MAVGKNLNFSLDSAISWLCDLEKVSSPLSLSFLSLKQRGRDDKSVGGLAGLTEMVCVNTEI